MEAIKTAFLQCELDYLDAIEALQKECGMTGKEAEALVEAWDDGDAIGTLSDVGGSGT